MGGRHGTGIVPNTADVLEMSVVREMKGVGGVCEMCTCLAQALYEVRGEWIRGMVWGFTNPVGTGGVLDLCVD